MRLLLHLGDFKTGTTALQDWLEESPPPGLIALPGAPHAALATGLYDRPGTAARLEAIGRALRETEAGALVVSAEHFEFADPDRLKAGARGAPAGDLSAASRLGPAARPRLPRPLRRVRPRSAPSAARSTPISTGRRPAAGCATPSGSGAGGRRSARGSSFASTTAPRCRTATSAAPSRRRRPAPIRGPWRPRPIPTRASAWRAWPSPARCTRRSARSPVRRRRAPASPSAGRWGGCWPRVPERRRIRPSRPTARSPIGSTRRFPPTPTPSTPPSSPRANR